MFDSRYHSIVQVKRQCKRCGNGGDWAVRIGVQHQQPSNNNPTEGHVTDSTSRQPRRVSVLFYIADEDGGQVKLEGSDSHSTDSTRLFSSGHHAVAGNWQLHVYSPGKAARSSCTSTTACYYLFLCFTVQVRRCCRQPLHNITAASTSYMTSTALV